MHQFRIRLSKRNTYIAVSDTLVTIPKWVILISRMAQSRSFAGEIWNASRGH